MDVVEDWPWCPRWYWAFDGTAGPNGEDRQTLGGMHPAIAIARAFKYREKGELGNLVPPPWTGALVSGLDYWDRLERASFDHRQSLRDFERKAADNARRAKDSGGRHGSR